MSTIIELVKQHVRKMDFDDHDGTLGELIRELEAVGFTSADSEEAVGEMVHQTELLVAVPRWQLDADDQIRRRDFNIGVSTTAEILKRYGQPHASGSGYEGEETWIYDQYVENDCEEEIPYDPRPHSIRDEQDCDRPLGCMIPFGPIYPEEALQISFYFDRDKILRRYNIAVALRLT